MFLSFYVLKFLRSWVLYMLLHSTTTVTLGEVLALHTCDSTVAHGLAAGNMCLHKASIFQKNDAY